MSGLEDAVNYLENGDWEAAHRIVQEDTTPLGCWAHGIVHLMEGDEANAGYWYRRAGRAMPEKPRSGIPDEIAALRARLDG